MKSFVSKIWVLREEPKNMKFTSSVEVAVNMSMDTMVEEFVETFILNQESEGLSIVKFKFANIYVLCSYVKYTTDDMAVIFADHDAYEIYVSETMKKVAEALKFTNKTISDYIYAKYN